MILLQIQNEIIFSLFWIYYIFVWHFIQPQWINRSLTHELLFLSPAYKIVNERIAIVGSYYDRQA